MRSPPLPPLSALPTSASLPTLPADAIVGSLLEALREHPCVLVQAPPGAGKTSRIPAALVRSAWGREGKIVVLEPRRLAAKAAAKRAASEQGWKLGEEVGYHVRFESRQSKATKLLFATEGIGLRRLQDDPFLEGIAAVVFDEFHERHLEGDLALAMIRQIQADLRPDLRIVLMSATLQTSALQEALGGCPLLESSGRLYPVERRYLPQGPQTLISERAVFGVKAAASQTQGDILVFLPGVSEIRQTQKLLQGLPLFKEAAIVALYGEMPLEEQEEVLRPAPPGKRKIICSTNLAESSLTIEGIQAVVDTGFVRQMRYDPWRDLNRLEVVRISRSSADQRAGRAGRMQAGLAYRLWSESEDAMMQEADVPEIRRLDLSGLVLSLLAWGETEPLRLPWLEAPKVEAIQASKALLRGLGAMEGEFLTALGRKMAGLPVPPRIARMLLFGHEAGILEETASVAALLTERDPFAGRIGERSLIVSSALESDPYDRYASLWKAANEDPSSVFSLLQVQAQLVSLVHASEARTPEGQDSERRGAVPREAERPHLRRSPLPPPQADKAEALHKGLLLAWPDRVVKRRWPQKPQGLMSDGRGICLRPWSAAKTAELFLAVELDPSQMTERSELWVSQAAALDVAWLPPERIKTTFEATFDPQTERVSSLERRRYGALLLSEKPTSKVDPQDVARVLVEAAQGALARILPPPDDPFHALLTRLRCLARWCPEASLPALTNEDLLAWLPELCDRCRSFDDLRRLPWAERLLERLTYPQQRFLKEEAPERWVVPSGHAIRLQYAEDGPPVLAVRIQEVFGMQETPTIAQGRITLVLHLLAPNGRPQQITTDLRSFWHSTYPIVRKELRQRYPKHAWPEDPKTATAQRRPTRPPSAS